jgi:hypothetical protein
MAASTDPHPHAPTSSRPRFNWRMILKGPCMLPLAWLRWTLGQPRRRQVPLSTCPADVSASTRRARAGAGRHSCWLCIRSIPAAGRWHARTWTKFAHAHELFERDSGPAGFIAVKDREPRSMSASCLRHPVWTSSNVLIILYEL